MSITPEEFKDQSGPMTCVITIQGNSANELFAAGPVDLRDYFLKEYLHVEPSDVKHIQFTQLKQLGEPLGPQIVHKDNF